MFTNLKKWLINYLTYDRPSRGMPLCDFERIRYEIRPCDVLLIEGRSHVGDVIQYVTQSPWTHAVIYIGRVHDIEDPLIRKKLQQYYKGPLDTQLIIEGILGKGIIVNPINIYKEDHIRICRARGLSFSDAQKVIHYTVNQLGKDYDVRQIFDLFRLLLPYRFLPTKWRSSLFGFHSGKTMKTVCSTMIANAFSEVNFPILPLVKKHETKGLELIHRNPKLFLPKDFDYSPYFDIIKYPFIEIGETAAYRSLPWNEKKIAIDDQLVEDHPETKKRDQDPKLTQIDL